MKSKIAGVALAAVMACGLGGVQRASATEISFQAFSGLFTNDGGTTINFDGDTSTGTGSLDLSSLGYTFYPGIDYAQIEDQNASFDFTDINTNVIISNIATISGASSVRAAEKSIHVYNPSFVYYEYKDVLTPNGFDYSVPFKHVGYDFYANFYTLYEELDLGIFPGPSDGYHLFDVTYFSSGDPIFGTFSGNPAFLTSVVPLPSSAPLFGIALAAFGGIGYASRRGRTKAA